MFCGIFLQRGALGGLVRTLSRLPQLVPAAPLLTCYRPLGLSFPPEWGYQPGATPPTPAAPTGGDVAGYALKFRAQRAGLAAFRRRAPRTRSVPRAGIAARRRAAAQKAKGQRRPGRAAPLARGLKKIPAIFRCPRILRGAGASFARRCGRALPRLKFKQAVARRARCCRPRRRAVLLTPRPRPSPRKAFLLRRQLRVLARRTQLPQAPLSARAVRRRRAAARKRASRAAPVTRSPRPHLVRGCRLLRSGLVLGGRWALPASQASRVAALGFHPQAFGAQVSLPLLGVSTPARRARLSRARQLLKLNKPRRPSAAAPRRASRLVAPGASSCFSANSELEFRLPPSQFILLWNLLYQQPTLHYSLKYCRLSRRVRKILKNKYRYSKYLFMIPPAKRRLYTLHLWKYVLKFHDEATFALRLQAFLKNFTTPDDETLLWSLFYVQQRLALKHLLGR